MGAQGEMCGRRWGGFEGGRRRVPRFRETGGQQQRGERKANSSCRAREVAQKSTMTERGFLGKPVLGRNRLAAKVLRGTQGERVS